jgi:hypothetical protein
VAIRFFIDVETGLPHIYEHNVSEDEVRDVLRNPFQEFEGRRNSRVAFGQARGGRFLKVIYSRDDDGIGIFVITPMI